MMTHLQSLFSLILMIGIVWARFKGYFVVKMTAAPSLSPLYPQGCVSAVTSLLSTAELHPATMIALVSLGALLVSHTHM